MFVALDFTLVSEWFMKWIKGTNQPSFKSFKLVLRLGLENISMRYRIGDTHGNMISGPETVYLSTRYILRIVRLGQLRKLDVYQKGILVKKYDKDIDKRKKGIFVSTILVLLRWLWSVIPIYSALSGATVALLLPFQIAFLHSL